MLTLTRSTVFFYFFIVFSLPLKAAGKEAVNTGLDHIDYSTLSHTIHLSRLRAGNHDAKGINDYFFTVTMYSLVISKEERKKRFKDRKKLSVLIGDFGELNIKALSLWQGDSKGSKILIDGDFIRKLTSDTMKEFGITESEVAIRVEIQMFESNKRFIFFGENHLIKTVYYYPIPQTIPHKPSRKNLTLSITDEFGTDVLLKVNYDLKKSKQNP